MKIKIKASVEQLMKSGIPHGEAVRLSGSVVDGERSGKHWVTPDLSDSPTNDVPWLLQSKYVVALDLSKPVQTRDGRPVEIKYVDESLEFAINGIITYKNGKRHSASWRMDGAIYSDGYPSENDLVQAPELRIEGWLNLYDARPIAQQVGNTIHPTKEEADEFADADRTACIKVSYRKGEGL